MGGAGEGTCLEEWEGERGCGKGGGKREGIKRERGGGEKRSEGVVGENRDGRKRL